MSENERCARCGKTATARVHDFGRFRLREGFHSFAPPVDPPKVTMKTWESGWCPHCDAPRLPTCERMRLIPAFDEDHPYSYQCKPRPVDPPKVIEANAAAWKECKHCDKWGLNAYGHHKHQQGTCVCRDGELNPDCTAFAPPAAEELKPCPFCGGKPCGPAVVPERPWADNPPMKCVWIHCSDCGAQIERGVGMDDAVIGSWNRRSPAAEGRKISRRTGRPLPTTDEMTAAHLDVAPLARDEACTRPCCTAPAPSADQDDAAMFAAFDANDASPFININDFGYGWCAALAYARKGGAK